MGASAGPSSAASHTMAVDCDPRAGLPRRRRRAEGRGGEDGRRGADGSRERRHTERDREEIRLERVCEREDKDMDVNRIES